MGNRLVVKKYLPTDNKAALQLEERCPQGEEMKISFNRKSFHQRSEMYENYLILLGFYEEKLVATVAGAVKEILINKRKVKAGYFYDLRVNPDYRKLKLRIAQDMCNHIFTRISPQTDIVYCMIAGRNLRALHLIKRYYNIQVTIPFKYIINPVYRNRKVKGYLKELKFEDIHGNFLKYHPDYDFYCRPDLKRLFGYVKSFRLESNSGEAGCSIWSSKEILSERIESIPKKFKALKYFLSAFSPFIKIPHIPQKGEPLKSWYLFDFYASNKACAKELFLHINNIAIQEGKNYLYLPLKETDDFFPVLRKCCWKFSPVIDYYILAGGKVLPHTDSDIYIDIRDL